LRESNQPYSSSFKASSRTTSKLSPCEYLIALSIFMCNGNFAVEISLTNGFDVAASSTTSGTHARHLLDISQKDMSSSRNFAMAIPTFEKGQSKGSLEFFFLEFCQIFFLCVHRPSPLSPSTFVLYAHTFRRILWMRNTFEIFRRVTRSTAGFRKVAAARDPKPLAFLLHARVAASSS
jgi:hypothetical protein